MFSISISFIFLIAFAISHFDLWDKITNYFSDIKIIEKPKVKSPYKAIDNLVIADIVERLQSMARKAISENYTISSNKVTQAMVDEAQSIINGLLAITDLKQFNDELVKLFTTIPRKMGSVSSYIN